MATDRHSGFTFFSLSPSPLHSSPSIIVLIFLVVFCIWILQISHKRLSKYEKEYYSLKERELESLDPQERLEVSASS